MKKCLAVSICLLGVTFAYAAKTPLSSQELRAHLLSSLKTQALTRKGQSFDLLLKTWENKYSTDAVSPLFNIASDRTLSDQERYMALMGAVKIGGMTMGPKIESFLYDSSWMIRSGALRSLGALHSVQQGRAALKLLKDPALVVRMEAVQTIEKLKPARASNALVSALKDQTNYHHGKAQWVPQRALRALVSLKASHAASELVFLLDQKNDPEFQRLAIKTLESLTGQSFKNKQTLASQVTAWKSFFRK